MIEYGMNDIITYRAHLGGERTVVVENRDADIKNGRPGFDGRELGTDQLVWGYDDQIVRVGS